MLVWAVLAMAVLTFPYLLRRTAPYGRHYAGAGWGPHISTRLAWVIMEQPAPVCCSARSIDAAGLLRDPERATARLRHFMRLYGIDG